ncbi:hypothetical protein T265_06802 [Opisthorchis viverrini]|uniref:Uncharacterized protein n=1 Tax=Opisthorchis viverrini TaxID=6198 RepID=A0A074ZEV5_OPIVI|nr:hypothetical protein T265_06802 [Opisthorchis viverrini]KER25831.1 hypothetical protein T265_06802 [Opisthorchis viverrini]
MSLAIDVARLGIPIQEDGTVTPFRCLAAMPPKGSTRAGILPGSPYLDGIIREAEVGLEPRTFQQIRTLSHLVCTTRSRCISKPPLT